MANMNKVLQRLKQHEDKLKEKDAELEQSIGSDTAAGSVKGRIKSLETNKEDASHKVTEFGETPSDTNYPSEKLVKDHLDLKADVDETGNKISLEMSDDNTYKIRAILKDKNGTVISTSAWVDLPLESMVVSGSYNSTTKEVTLTLQHGNPITFSIADLISGLQSEITSNNKLDADLVDDANSTHKFVTAAEKEQITTNANDIADIKDDIDDIKDGTDIDSFGDAESAINDRLNKSMVGYISLQSLSSTYSLSDAEYAELIKPYAIIQVGDDCYYKSSKYSTDTTIKFVEIPNIRANSSSAKMDIYTSYIDFDSTAKTLSEITTFNYTVIKSLDGYGLDSVSIAGTTLLRLQSSNLQLIGTLKLNALDKVATSKDIIIEKTGYMHPTGDFDENETYYLLRGGEYVVTTAVTAATYERVKSVIYIAATPNTITLPTGKSGTVALLEDTDLTLDPTSNKPIANSVVTNNLNTMMNLLGGKTNFVLSYATADTNNSIFNSSATTITITANDTIKDINGNVIPVSTLLLGDIFLVTETDKPDRWVGSVTKTNDVVTSAVLYQMETTKVDLSNYATEVSFDAVNNKITYVKNGVSYDVVTTTTLKTALGLGTAADKNVTDNTTATAASSSDTNLITGRTMYNALPNFNGNKNYNTNSGFYAPTSGGTAGQILKSNGTTSAPSWVDVDGGIAGDSLAPLSTKTHVKKFELSWTSKSWTGMTNFNGCYIWTDGENIYYSYGDTQKYLNIFTGTWANKTWAGLTSFTASNIWTDGENIYYSYNTAHYILNKSTSTWSVKSPAWTGLTSFSGYRVWTDGITIYYSNGNSQYYLDKSASKWYSKTWSGMTNFDGRYVWTDGNNIYYSNGGINKILDVTTSTWSDKTWSNAGTLNSECLFSDGCNIYNYAGGSSIKVLDKTSGKWITAYTNTSGITGDNVWSDGTNIYYSSNATQYVLTKNTVQTTKTSANNSSKWYLHKLRFDTYYSEGDEDYYVGVIFDYYSRTSTAFTTAEEVFNELKVGQSIYQMSVFNNTSACVLDTDVYGYMYSFATINISSDYTYNQGFADSDHIKIISIVDGSRTDIALAYFKKQSNKTMYTILGKDIVIPLYSNSK